ncbi:MAG: nicotinate-nucleotide adenylyltransferase [Candidatus Endobugula sp.]|jgi:nicotinate-nucleotide adenylyltransferase
MKAIGIFGGTFDPVHNGHLQMALEAKDALGLAEVRLVPCHRPPHRDEPMLTAPQRLSLLSLAVKALDAQGEAGLVVDKRELLRPTTSYTIDTLLSCRQEFGDAVSLALMLGADAFAQLDTWRHWQQLRKLAHIVVMARPDSGLPDNTILNEWMANADTLDIVTQQASGGFILLQQSLLAISATQIRQQLIENKTVCELPPVVADYIQQQGLYKKQDLKS